MSRHWVLAVVLVLGACTGATRQEEAESCDCGGGLTCVDGACVALCNRDDECAAFQSCHNGTCVDTQGCDLGCDTPPAAGCNEADDAFVSYEAVGECVDESCAYSVATSLACPACSTSCVACDTGACPPLAGGCRTSAPCEAGACAYHDAPDDSSCTLAGGGGVCSGGACVECIDAADCDSQAGLAVCLLEASCNDGVCAYTYEATRACGGMSCVDGELFGPSQCGSDGSCPLVSGDCGGFGCDGDACATGCDGAGGCAPGYACDGANHCDADQVAPTFSTDPAGGEELRLTLTVTFSEPVLGADALASYEVAGPGAGTLRPWIVTGDPFGDTYDLVLDGRPTTGEVTLSLSGVTDAALNALADDAVSFVAPPAWTVLARGPTASDVAYDGVGVYVATAADGFLWRWDGVAPSWTLVSIGILRSLYVIVWDPFRGEFHAGGEEMEATSPDGLTWDIVPRAGWASSIVCLAEGCIVNDDDVVPGSVVHDGTQFVRAYGAQLFTSDDGVDWTLRHTLAVPRMLYDIAYGVVDGAPRYIAVGGFDFGATATSADGISWTDGAIGSEGLQRVSFDGERFITSDRESKVYTWDGTGVASTGEAGVTTIDTGLPLFNIFPDGTRYIGLAAEHSDIIQVSSDLETWTPLLDVFMSRQGLVAAGGGLVSIGFGAEIVRSTNGVDFSRVATTGLSGEYGGGIAFATIGATPTLVATVLTQGIFYSQSTTGESWTLARGTSGFTDVNVRARYLNAKFWVPGNGGTLYSSGDGTAWSSENVGDTHYMHDIAFSGSKYAVVGEGGRLLTYDYPISTGWTARTSGTTNQLRGITYGNGRFVAVGYRVITTSTDGVTWSAQALSTETLRDVATDGTHFVAVGNSGVIMTSPDGLTWTRRLAPTPYGINAVVYDGGRFVAAGDIGNIMAIDADEYF